MQDQVVVTGIVLKQMPVGESDRVVTILTGSRGKIRAFARGARKPNSRFAASTGAFCSGTFHLYEGKDSYNLAEADIKVYFDGLMTDIENACYASYFAEIADYYCRENNDEQDMMKLIFVALKALEIKAIPNPLVRAIYELKAIAVNGEYPGPPEGRNLSEAATYALQYIGITPPERLFSFSLSDQATQEVISIAEEYCKRYIGHNFKSLEILNTLC